MASPKTSEASSSASPRNKRPPSADAPLVALSKSWLIGLAALIVMPWIVAGVVYTWNHAEPSPSPADSNGHADATELSKGPWGRLTSTRVVVSPPLEYVSTNFVSGRAVEWAFPETSPDLLEKFLLSTGLSREDISRLRAVARPDSSIEGLIVRPDRELVRRMSPEIRARVYGQLAKTWRNERQRAAYRFRGTTPEDWFGGSLVSPATRALVEPLVYRQGDYLFFSDFDLVREEIPDQEEVRRLAKTLVRQSALLVELTVDRVEDVPALAEYWGRGGRRIDVRPLLESVAASDATHSIDIAHLLPTFARNNLYRYPKVRTADLEQPLLANCLWSALNFFATAPDDRLLNLETSIQTLKNDYYVVEHGYQLGDVIAFIDKDDNLFHVATFLADQLVFTKNGTSQLSPWTITTLDDLKAFYQPRSASPRLVFHRRKDF
jgi:hypothetical protein